MGVEEVLKRKTGVIVGDDVYNLCMAASISATASPVASELIGYSQVRSEAQFRHSCHQCHFVLNRCSSS